MKNQIVNDTSIQKIANNWFKKIADTYQIDITELKKYIMNYSKEKNHDKSDS